MKSLLARVSIAGLLCAGCCICRAENEDDLYKQCLSKVTLEEIAEEKSSIIEKIIAHPESSSEIIGTVTNASKREVIAIAESVANNLHDRTAHIIAAAYGIEVPPFVKDAKKNNEKNTAPVVLPIMEKERQLAIKELNDFAEKNLPATFALYKSVRGDISDVEKNMKNVAEAVRANGEKLEKNDNYIKLAAQRAALEPYLIEVTDELFGRYCMGEMKLFTSEKFAEMDKVFATEFGAKYNNRNN